MKNVLVLGASGMLGSMVADVLSRSKDLCVTGSVRTASLQERFCGVLPRVRWVRFQFDMAGRSPSFDVFAEQDWIINAIGITKPLVRDDDPAQIETAIAVNSVLPHEIGRHAARHGARVLQIATDCVYSGSRGAYVEKDPQDALDVYGKTKSLGETFQPNVHHLRCSIIGPEPKDFKFLIEWFRKQPQGASVNGFVNHRWNGITTLQFARLCRGVIEQNMDLPHLQHVVPCGTITKAEMLRVFAAAYDRRDIRINDVEARYMVDRTLATENFDLSEALWRAAGYQQTPTVPVMIAELASYDYRAAA